MQRRKEEEEDGERFKTLSHASMEEREMKSEERAGIELGG